MLKNHAKFLLANSADISQMLCDTADQSWSMVQAPDFPNQVRVQPAPAVEGDFADTNPRSFVNAGPGGLVAGPGGARVGSWCWWNNLWIDSDNAPSAVSNLNGSGPPTGILFRNQQGLITQYLQASGMVVPQGFPLALLKAGGIFVVNNNATANAQVGNAVFARFSDGASLFGASGTVGSTGLGSLTATGSIGAGTSTFLGAINGNILTATGTLTGNLVIPVGASLTGGTGIAAGTVIVAQISGVSGSAGGAQYALNIPQQSVATALLTATFGILTVTGTVTGGNLAVGDTLTGTAALTANTTITALGTGSGQAGTYYLNNSQTAASQSLTTLTNVQTKWVAMSSGKPGELIKISSDLLG